MSDKLVEIPIDEWNNLRDLYQVNWPTNLVGFYTIDNYIKWIIHDKHKLKHFHIYSLNGDWSDGTFLIIDRYQLIVNSLEVCSERLKIALSLLDWTHGYFIMTLLSRHHDPVYEILKSKNFIINDDDCLTSLYYMAKEQAADLDLGTDGSITFDTMSENDVQLADSVWPNKHQGTLYLLKRLSKWNANIAAYDLSGKMLAWVFRLQTGALAALQVDAEHQQKGYGSLILKKISKIQANLNMDTFGCVNKHNYRSIKMFEKVGFINIDDIYWIWTYPKGNMIEWNDDDDDDE